MFDVVLFFGLPIDHAFEKAMETADHKILDLYFHSKNGDYLSEVAHEGVRYFGKYTGEIASIAELILLQNNIYSILKKAVPQYSFETAPLILFPTPKPT